MKFPHGFKLLAILPSNSAGKFLKKIWNLEKWGVLRPPSRSLVKSKITPPNPLVLKDFSLTKKKKEIGQKRLYVYKVDTNTKK